MPRSYHRLLIALIDNPEQLWTSMRDQFGQLKDFIANLQSSIGELKQLLSQMDYATRDQILCGIAGYLAVDVALAEVGVSAIRLTADLSQAILRLRLLGSLMAMLGKANTGRNVLTADRILLYLQGQLPGEAFEISNRLIRSGQTDAALGILTCEP